MRLGMIFAMSMRFFVGILVLFSEPSLSQSREKSKKNNLPQEEYAKDRAYRLRPGVAANVVIGIPHPIDLSFGWMQPKGESHMGSLGLFQKKVPSGNGVRDIDIKMQHIEYRYRSEPWQRHPLYWQIAGGYQQIDVEGTRTVTITQEDIRFTTDIRAALSIRSLYYTPKVGITKHFSSGLTLSWGFGYLVPALVTSDFKSQVPGDPLLDELLQQLGSYQTTRRDLERIGKRLGQLGIPLVDIIDVAWRF